MKKKEEQEEEEEEKGEFICILFLLIWNDLYFRDECTLGYCCIEGGRGGRQKTRETRETRESGEDDGDMPQSHKCTS